MGFSAICFSHKYLLIKNISGKAKKQCSSPFNDILCRTSELILSFLARPIENEANNETARIAFLKVYYSLNCFDHHADL